MDFNANGNEWARISANLVKRLDFHTVSYDRSYCLFKSQS